MTVRISPKLPQSIAVEQPLAPWEDTVGAAEKPQQTMLLALAEFADLPVKTDRKLYLLHKTDHTEYRVLGYDSWLRIVRLVGPNNAKLAPVVGERENALYTPIWR